MSKKFVSKQHLKIGVIFLCAISCCAVFAIVFSLPARTPKGVLDTSAFYDLSLKIDENNVLYAKQEVLYTAPANLDRLVFHVYPNAIAKNGDTDAFEVLDIQINRQSVDFEIYGATRTLLQCFCSLQKGDVCTVYLEYRFAIPHSNDRLGITESGTMNIACFYPAVAVYENGWREDEYCSLGDPFFSDSASFYASVQCNENLSVASSGFVEETSTENGLTTWNIEAENVRDFAMCIGRFEKASATANGVNINYFYVEDDNANGTMERISNSISTFSKAFGEYPYSHFTLAQSDLSGGGGMEYGSFAVVCKTADKNEYLDSITHEIAHQWWYNSVGNDQLNSPWLDEGLSEFCTFYYHFLTGDRLTFTSAMADVERNYNQFYKYKHLGFDSNMNRHLSSYVSQGEYVAVVYCKGAMLFYTLRNLVGDDNFCKALRCYYENNKFDIATQSDLCSAFKSQGFDVENLVSNYVAFA